MTLLKHGDKTTMTECVFGKEFPLYFMGIKHFDEEDAAILEYRLPVEYGGRQYQHYYSINYTRHFGYIF